MYDLKDLVAHLLYEGVYDGKSEFYCTQFALEVDFDFRGITAYEVYEVRLQCEESGRGIAHKKLVKVT